MAVLNTCLHLTRSQAVYFSFVNPSMGLYYPVNPGEQILQAVSRPFTRSITDWWKAPELLQISKHRKNSFYTPHGDPKQWTKAQQRVHEEEKAAWTRLEITKAVEAAQRQARSRSSRKEPVKTVRVGYYNRKILAVIDGRRNGQPAVAKGWNGLPLDPQPPMTQEDGREEPHIEAAAAKLWRSVTCELGKQETDDANGQQMDEANLEAAGKRL